MRNIIHYLILVLALSACQSILGLSSYFQLTSTNISQYAPLIQLTVKNKGESHRQFTLTVKLPRGTPPSDSISGHLELFDGSKLLASSGVAFARSAAPSRIHLASGVSEQPLVFTFIVSEEYLPNSKFYLSHDQSDSWRFDQYWFYLKDFADAK